MNANTHLHEIDTPALLIDQAILEANIARMADFFAGAPVNLRPHVKTHKCPQIAQRQVRAGAIGVTCAKVSEAQVMARAGITDILIANQVAGPVKIERLTDLARTCDLIVAVDDARNVRALDGACCEKGVRLRVLVEVDIGMGRCGVGPGKPALALAEQVAAAPGLHFAGLMGYEGHLVLLQDPDERRDAVRAAFAPLGETRALIEAHGLPVEIVSGGGTGTYDLAPEVGVLTECQAGSYVFMDATYRKVRPEIPQAISLLSTVVSRAVPERLVLDAGLKTLTTEFGWPQPLGVEGASVRYLSEEHTVLDLEKPAAVALAPGDRVRFVPSHVCTTVNLHDRFYVVQGERVVDVWPIAARGCSQ